MLGQDRLDGGHVAHRAGLSEPALRPVGEKVIRQHGPEAFMHAVDGIAHRHRAERVAVISAANRQQPIAIRLAARDPVLDRHLDRDLDGHRARIGEKHVLQRRGRQVDQPARQGHRRRVRQAAEHHVGHRLELVPRGPIQLGDVVAVYRAPPR